TWSYSNNKVACMCKQIGWNRGQESVPMFFRKLKDIGMDFFIVSSNICKGESVLNIQNMILTLQKYWSSYNCILMQAYDVEKGAGTMSPMTLLRSLGPEPWNVAYVEPSRRPDDGRYGENPNRLYQLHQCQVIMIPAPEEIQAMYLKSLEVLGINALGHDIRCVEDNWENPTLGASGLGWEVWLDGMEITQFTYFQQIGGLEANPVAVELTYGIER